MLSRRETFTKCLIATRHASAVEREQTVTVEGIPGGQEKKSMRTGGGDRDQQRVMNTRSEFEELRRLRYLIAFMTSSAFTISLTLQPPAN
eukprot:746558-Hanusia_phi.AAC.8